MGCRPGGQDAVKPGTLSGRTHPGLWMRREDAVRGPSPEWGRLVYWQSGALLISTVIAAMMTLNGRSNPVPPARLAGPSKPDSEKCRLTTTHRGATCWTDGRNPRAARESRAAR